MKNVKSVYRIVIAILMIIGITNPLFADNKDIKDHFEKSFKVSETDKLELQMYDSDLQIITWSNSEIKLTGEILISGSEKEDIDKILKAFKNPEIVQGEGRIEIKTAFTEGTFNFMGLYKRTKLSTGENVSVSSIKSTYVIWVPESIAFKLLSKYNNVKAPNLKGKLDFEFYSANLNMGDIGDNSTFDSKYSTINIGMGQNVRFDIYDSKISTLELKKVIINSKYSTFNGKAINLLALESYSDKITLDDLNGIDMNAKYTTLNAKGKSNIGKFSLYDCVIEVGDFTRIESDSKYSEITASNVGTFNIKESYSDTYRMNDVNEFSCKDSKYSKISIAGVRSSINLPSTFDTNFRVDLIGANFTSFTGDFKYGSVTLIADPTLDYRLICENSYGEINYPKERFKNKPLIYIEKDSKSKLDCSTDSNAKCEFNFTSYNTNFTIE